MIRKIQFILLFVIFILSGWAYYWFFLRSGLETKGPQEIPGWLFLVTALVTLVIGMLTVIEKYYSIRIKARQLKNDS